MKNLLLLIVALFAFTASAQKIELRGTKFFIDGEQVPTYEIKQKMKDTDYASYANLKKYNSRSAIGGFLLGFGGGLIVADVVVGLVSNVQYPTAMTYIGAASAVASIPVLVGRKKYLNKAVDLYNQSLTENQQNQGSNFQVNLVSNNRGVGLQLNF